MWRFDWRKPLPQEPDNAGELIDDYVRAEDALRQFTDRNFGRMCALCARWTLFAAKTNAAAREEVMSASPDNPQGAPAAPVEWRLQSWVTNCCNANHALESMSEDSLAGIVASREEGRRWWQTVARAASAPCAALTEQGCALQRGRPELCNRYFCEAVRDYLWLIGGEHEGAGLAARLDDLQRRWASLYLEFQKAILAARQAGVAGRSASRPPSSAATSETSEAAAERRLTNLRYRRRQQVRRAARWDEFFDVLRQFDAAIAQHARPITADELTGRCFKVNGERNLYAPFFVQEVDAIAGEIRRPASEADG